MGLFTSLSLRNLFQRRHLRACARSRPGQQLTPRVGGFERLEPRQVFAANPLVVAAVYTESDIGSDKQGDTFEVTFEGGAPNTQLTRLIIDGDQRKDFGNTPGFSTGDVFFDTVEERQSLGADHAIPFAFLHVLRGDGSVKSNASVTATVADGGTLLVLDLVNVTVGDRLVFTIDVDEVETFDPNQTDMDVINGEIDPLTSGAEFQGALMTAHFVAPHYHAATSETIFLNRYDASFTAAEQTLGSGKRLQVPRDDELSNRDRTAGAVGQLVQQPLAITISGTVYHDRNFDLQQQVQQQEQGIAGVTLALYQRNAQGQYEQVVRGGVPVTTQTNSQGDYHFGLDLNLLPGIYQVRETQPAEYQISVGSIPGTVAQSPVGVSSGGDMLTDIDIPLGGTHAVDYDFAEANPARISGFVYHDRDNDGLRENGEAGIGAVRVSLFDSQGNLVAQTTTSETGFYEFNGLRAGTYRLVEDQPLTWIDGLDTPGDVQGAVRGTVLANDTLGQVLLTSGDAGTEYNFGERQGTLSGRVHHDRDGDCVLDPDETPLAGVTITLVHQDGSQRVTTTDAQGYYEFRELPAGVYTVIQQQPSGFFNGHQEAGNGGGNDTVPNIISNVGLGGDLVSLQNYDFCEVLGSLSGYVYHDRDNDGAREPQHNEEAIAGVVLHLLHENGQPVRDAQGQPRTAITDANGFYRFDDLGPGVYRVTELQPSGWLDGLDTPGFVAFGSPQQRSVGQVIANDQIGHIALVQNENDVGSLHGVNYNFGELRPGSIAGMVHSDINNNCIFEPNLTFPQSQQREIALANITITLRDAQGNVVATTQTDEQGRYRFDNLRPGTYSIDEQQPADYFDAGHEAGTLGGDATLANRISNIVILSGDAGADYDFCETPPAQLSGYVFQDGQHIFSVNGQAPAQLHVLRNGVRTADDTPLAGVWVELRNGLDGSPIDGSEALPGHYGPGPIRVQTDANGFYEFTGLPRGNYAVYESHPQSYIDGVDTPGTTQGVALNAHQTAPLAILSRMANNPPPRFDAILNIALGAGQNSRENNFSEVRITGLPLVPETPRTPPTNIPQVLPPPLPPLPPALLGAPPKPPAVLEYGPGGVAEVTWHLSIVDAGRPRGENGAPPHAGEHWAHLNRLNKNWIFHSFRAGRWVIGTNTDESGQYVEQYFGLPGAIPLAGDFDGDGQAELALFHHGEWYIDVNGNGKWDEGDLWARLGDENDQPVVGDWDGDGKDDIGIFGPIWAGDPRAIAHEPGLPDSKNRIQPSEMPKNVPPLPEHATDRQRVLQLTADGAPRTDFIDHVFQFGSAGDVPVAGDWDGEGIDNIGVFRHGSWTIDVNGDGQLSDEDRSFEYGASGDAPLVGDFNGDGVDEVGVYRNGKVTLDTNRNYQLDATDRVFQLVGSGRPVVGDFNADGTDDVVSYEELESRGAESTARGASGESAL